MHKFTVQHGKVLNVKHRARFVTAAREFVKEHQLLDVSLGWDPTSQVGLQGSVRKTWFSSMLVTNIVLVYFYFITIINHNRYPPEEVRGFPVGRQRGRSSLWWLTHQESWGRTITKGSLYLVILFIIWGTAITKGSQNSQSLASS